MMRWVWASSLFPIVGLVWYVGTIERRVELASRVGWAQVCWHAPHQRLNPVVLDGLREAWVQVGHRGWQPTVAWVNEQCAALGMGRE